VTNRARLVDGVLGIAAAVTLATTMILGLRLPPTQEQEDYARLIAIHPAIAWTSYLAFGLTAVASLLWLIPRTRSRRWDRLAASSAEVGVVFTALMLVTGSIWGRPTWGVWWAWEARLILSALMLALLLGYVALRRVSVDTERRALVSAISALVAVVVIPINHFAVTWWRTLHQGRSLANVSPKSRLDGEYIAVMFVGLVAMTLVFAWLVQRRYRVETLAEELEDEGLTAAIEARRQEGREVLV
jgi:heme exporter protein C